MVSVSALQIPYPFIPSLKMFSFLGRAFSYSPSLKEYPQLLGIVKVYVANCLGLFKGRFKLLTSNHKYMAPGTLIGP